MILLGNTIGGLRIPRFGIDWPALFSNRLGEDYFVYIDFEGYIKASGMWYPRPTHFLNALRPK